MFLKNEKEMLASNFKKKQSWHQAINIKTLGRILHRHNVLIMSLSRRSLF
jgi:hypothetical protein